MKISVITPSIRPLGLLATFETLQKQTFMDWEWLPRLSIPGPKPDLCYQVNAALQEAQGELIVFLQDWITISPAGLSRMWDKHLEDPLACWTAPVGKLQPDRSVKWDWRTAWKPNETVPFDHWEIDWGAAPRAAFLKLREFEKEDFCEQYDSGFGWENVDLAYRFEFMGYRFKVDPYNQATAFDHDVHEPHPYKPKPNMDLWGKRKALIEASYGHG